MPATAGRVRMPANNRVHSSAALQTHGIWQSAIGYDPYAPNKDDAKNSSQPKSSNSEPEGENAYASFQGLLALARITGSNSDETRGACKKCGRVGHLTFQCRNFLSIKDDKEKDPDAIQASVLSGLDKLKGHVGKKVNGKSAVEDESESEEEDESESSDSDADSEIERIIAGRYEKKGSSKGRSSRKKELSDDGESDSKERKKRGRSKKRSGKRGSGDLDDDESGRKRRKEKRRRRNDSSDEEKSSDEDKEHRQRKRKSRKEKRRRRSHHYSDDSDSSGDSDKHKRKSRRAASSSDSDINGSDDSRVGRGAKRSEKRHRKRHHKHHD